MRAVTATGEVYKIEGTQASLLDGPSSRTRRPTRRSCPNFIEAETNSVKLGAKVFAEVGENQGSTIVRTADLQVGLIVPGTKRVPTASRTRACPDDVVGLNLRELGTKRLNLRHRHVAVREAQRERMLIWGDTRPRILSTWNEHHGPGLREVAVNRHGSANWSNTSDESAGVIDCEMKARLQRLRTQTSFLERRTKRGRGQRIEPQEGEYGVVRGRPTAWTPGRLQGLMSARDHRTRTGALRKSKPPAASEDRTWRTIRDDRGRSPRAQQGRRPTSRGRSDRELPQPEPRAVPSQTTPLRERPLR